MLPYCKAFRYYVQIRSVVVFTCILSNSFRESIVPFLRDKAISAKRNKRKRSFKKPKSTTNNSLQRNLYKQ